MCSPDKVAYVWPTQSENTTQTVRKAGYLLKRRHNRLSPRLCTQVKKYVLPQLTRRFISWSSQVLPKAGVEIQTREVKSQKGWRPGGPTLSCTFSTLPQLVRVCLYRRYLRKSTLLILKTNLVVGCSPSSDLGRTQKSLGTRWSIAILA